MATDDSEKRFCLKCSDTPGYVEIKDPRQEQPERMRCPNGCEGWEKTNEVKK